MATKRVLIAGGTGMIGQALDLALRGAGWEVHTLTRDASRHQRDPFMHAWDPAAPLDLDSLGAFDVIVNLAGSTIAKMPWTKRRREDILNSRITATTTLVNAMTAASKPPRAFVSASAVGYYGSRDDEILTEDSAPGKGFLADVCRAWEDAALAAPARTRVVIVRIGLVLWRNGALAPLRGLALSFLAGPVAGGRHWWPWIGMRDVVRILAHAVTSPLTGIVNAVGPTPATSGEIVREIAAHYRRPYWMPAPGWGISLLLGQAGRELLLSSQRVEPAVLRREGFTFATPTADDALSEALD